jgi:uncharacterized protein (TIGR03067 family)
MKKSMFGVGALLLSLGVTIGAVAQEKQSRHTARPEKEQSRQPARHKVPNGTEVWRMVSHIKDGKKATAAVRSVGVAYDGNNFTLAHGRSHTIGRYKLDPSKTPMQIDMTITSGRDKGASIKGIYELKGDKLIACYAPAGKARPTAFSSRPGSGDRLYVRQRVETAQTTKGQAGQSVTRGTKGAQKQTAAKAPTATQTARKGFAPQSFAATGPVGPAATQLINPITAAKDNPQLAGALAAAGAAVLAAPLAVAAAPVAAAIGAGEDIAAGISAADLAGAVELPADIGVDADGIPFVPGIAF